MATFSQRQDTKERKELPAAGPQNQAAGRRKDEAGMEMLRRPYLPAFRAPAAGFPTGRDFGRLWRPSRGIGISLRSTTGARRAPLRSGERKSRTCALTLASPFLRQGHGGQAGGRGEMHWRIPIPIRIGRTSGTFARPGRKRKRSVVFAQGIAIIPSTSASPTKTKDSANFDFARCRSVKRPMAPAV